MNPQNKFSVSKFAIIFVLASSLIITAHNQTWKKSVIEWDIISYYAYLPGLFIYEDLTFSFVFQNPPKGVKIWVETTPENKHVIKMTSGLAILYAPFFLIAHGIAKLQPEMYAPNGYSMVYSLLLILSDIFYLIVGFIFLRKILLRYFTDSVAGITLLCLFFGTNLLFYSMFEVMAHCYLFCLITVFLYYTIKWYEMPSIRHSIYVGLSLGLTTLTRPVDVVIVILFALYGVASLKEIKMRVNYLWTMRKKVILIALAAFAIVSIQIIYWKYATGHFFYWSYSDESFFWSNPHIINGLFGFRKGWYIYTPIMIFATVGLFLTHKYAAKFTVSFVLLFALYTYVIFSWWCWWYGAGLSCRPMIDIYSIMAIGLASFITFLIEIKYDVIKYSIALIMTIFVLYGTMTNIQYNMNALHYDAMSFESWKRNFLSTEVGGGYYENLINPDYKNALKNKPEEPLK